MAEDFLLARQVGARRLTEHGRVDEPGSDGVDPHAVRGHLARDRLHQPQHGAFRRRIRRHLRHAQVCGHGGNKQDAARFAREHLRQDGLRQRVRAHQMHVQNAPQVLLRYVEHRLFAVAAGVVDEHVDRAELRFQRADEIFRLRGLRYVENARVRVFSKLRAGLAQHVPAPPGDHHARARGDEAARHRKAKPRSAAGDENQFAGHVKRFFKESVHKTHPSFCRVREDPCPAS